MGERSLQPLYSRWLHSHGFGIVLLSARHLLDEFLAGSVLLAFAYLFPDFEILLFFVLPVKVKWIALLTWGLFIFTLVAGGWPDRIGVLAAGSTSFCSSAKTSCCAQSRAAERWPSKRSASHKPNAPTNPSIAAVSAAVQTRATPSCSFATARTAKAARAIAWTTSTTTSTCPKDVDPPQLFNGT